MKEELKQYIEKSIDEVNLDYPGLITNNDKILFIDDIINNSFDYETNIKKINNLKERKINEYNEFVEQLKILDELLYEDDKQVNLLDINGSTGLYLNSQQIDLILITDIKTSKELINYVNNICNQFSNKTISDLLPSFNTNINYQKKELEIFKRKIFQLYKDTLISYLNVDSYSNQDIVYYKLSKMGLPEEQSKYYASLVGKISNKEILYMLNQTCGNDFVYKFNRFAKDDFENIKSISYEEMYNLNEIITNDENITTIIISTGKYNNVIKETGTGLIFDTNDNNKAIAYLNKKNKHMRYHALIDHSHLNSLIKQCKTKENHDEILKYLKRYISLSFDYINKNNVILEDGTMMINTVEIFNELVEKNKTDKNSNYEMVWEKYFGITEEELVSCFDNITKPNGVKFMYNETTLTESSNKRTKVEEVIYKLTKANPNLVDSFGDQSHISDEEFMTDSGITNLVETEQLKKRVQDGNLIVNGEKQNIKPKTIEITEHDFHFTPKFLKLHEVNKRSNNPVNIDLSEIKKTMQTNYSDIIKSNGVENMKTTYWCIFDKSDHNLVRENKKRSRYNSNLKKININRVKNNKPKLNEIPYLKTQYASLIPNDRILESKNIHKSLETEYSGFISDKEIIFVLIIVPFIMFLFLI